ALRCLLDRSARVELFSGGKRRRSKRSRGATQAPKVKPSGAPATETVAERLPRTSAHVMDGRAIRAPSSGDRARVVPLVAPARAVVRHGTRAAGRRGKRAAERHGKRAPGRCG